MAGPLALAQMGAWVEAASVGAVVGVAAPVSAVLILYWWAVLSGTVNPAHILQRAARWRPTLAAALAAVPGCAGGIAVSRLFLEGGVDQGALLAAHLATSGDAAFVLLVDRPGVALLLFAIAFLVGSTAGTLFSRWTVRPGRLPAAVAPVGAGLAEASPAAVPRATVLPYYLMVALAATAAAAHLPAAVPALAALGLAVAVLTIRPAAPATASPPARALAGAGALAARDAAEITLWVFAADLAFAVGQTLAAAPLRDGLQAGVLAVTVAAALVGAIPGCGPQIFVARLFVAGGLPLSAAVANTVGQHGDAIFPLLARDRKTALAITALQAALAVALGVVAARL